MNTKKALYSQPSDKSTYEGSGTFRQDDLRWRSILFLPFNFVWRSILSVTGLFYFNMIIYEQIFVKIPYRLSKSSVEDKILKAITVLYVIDIVLSILHKSWESVQKSMPYQPKSFTVIIIDTLSVVPTRFFMHKTFLSKDGIIMWSHVFSMNGCLRIYRIFFELINLQHKMGANPLAVTMIQQNAIALCLVSVCCSLWYSAGYIYYNRPRSWINEIIHGTLIDPTNPVSMLKFCFIHIYGKFSNDAVTDVIALRKVEVALTEGMKYIGFLALIYVFTSMIESFLKCQTHIYKIKSHIIINLKCLKGKKFKEIKEFYSLYWNNWSCIKRCPLLQSFPLCLQKDVLTDVYWNAITHSHVLRNFSPNIQRQFSLVMQSKFLQPGEYIFRKGDVKYNYYYIATGVVQIMSYYDGVSPIMTVSGGSCIGEASLILPTSSPTDVICSSVCEVRFLTYQDFHKVLVLYPSSKTTLRVIKREHIGLAKKMSQICKFNRKDNYLMKLYGVMQEDNLKWLKQRWRKVYNIKLEFPNISEKGIQKLVENDVLPIDCTHTSKYLDLIVLGGEVAWQADKCCIKSNCSYILEPDCNFLKVWLVFIFVLITIDCIILPYRIAFMIETTEGQVIWDHIICYAYALDIYFQAVTGFRSVEITIMKPMALLRHHLKSPRFLLDIIGSIPFRELLRLLFIENEISPNWTLNRLLKFVRAYLFFKYRHGLIMADSLIIIVIKYLYLYVFTLYIGVCFTFLNACQYDVHSRGLVCDNKSWFVFYHSEIIIFPKFVNDDDSKSKFADQLNRAFFAALNFVYRYLLKTGLKDVPPMDMNDFLLMGGFLFIANNLFVLTVSEITALCVSTHRRRVVCKELIRNLHFVLSQKKLPVGLLGMLDSFISLQWKVNEFIEGNVDSTCSSEIISPILEAENEKMIRTFLKSIPFFDDINEENYYQICRGFRIFTVPENFIFCRAGEQPNSFNMIISGYCKLTSMLKEDILTHPEGKIIGSGASFPLMEVAQNKPCLQTTVSVTVCEVAAIEVIELRSILYRDPFKSAQILKATLFKMNDVDVVVSKIKYLKNNNPTKSFVTCKRNKKPMKKTYFLLKLIRLMRMYVVTLFWNPPFIIHPNGIFMLIWEMLKVIQVIISIMYAAFMHVRKCRREKFMTEYIPTTLDVFSFVDIILRIHVGHYNELGVLTNLRMHYLSHSFIIDFISSLPVHKILSQYDFQVRFYLTVLCKSLQLYRISGFISALQIRYDMENFKIFLINFLLHTILVFIVIANCMFGAICVVNCRDEIVNVTCKNESWITTNGEIWINSEDKSPLYFIMFCFNMVLTIFLGNDQKAFTLFEHEIKFMACWGAIALVVKLYYISRGISLHLNGSVSFTRHRERMGLYWMFVKNEGGSINLASVIAKHFNHEYSKLKGIKMKEFVSSLHPSLQTDLTFAIYYKSMLCLHKFVGEKKSLMKHLTNKVEEIFYKSEIVVIDHNEINDDIYFIHEGFIDVFDEDDEWVQVLGPGSMFGSFEVLGKKRQSNKYISQSHTNLVRIKSRIFFLIFKDYGKQHLTKFLNRVKDKEYISHDSKGEVNIEVDKFSRQKDSSCLNRNMAWYKWTMFGLSMVLPYVTVFPVSYCILMEGEEKLFFLIIYVLDVLSVSRIFIAMSTTYTDVKTGYFISDLRQIRIRYLKSPVGFLLDLISCLPFELFYYLIKRKWFTKLYGNRLLRLIMMSSYITKHNEKIYIRPWLRWLEYVAYVTLLPYLYMCFWQHLTCPEVCRFIKPSENGTFIEITTKKKTEMFIRCSLNEIFSVFTFSPSFHFGKPTNVIECVTIIIFSLISFSLFPSIIGCFASVLQMGRYTKRSFEYNIQCMKLYLQLRDISDSLLKSLWDYSLLLWNSDSGELLPHYLQNAPQNMKSKLFYDLFGAHLQYNVLFEECHRTFVVQLAGRLRRSIYFPGDFIIRKYDVDNRMYFINSGEIDSIEYDDLNNEIVIQVFITGQCFGFVQGLFERAAHLSTYKARSMVEILTLQKDDWRDLILAFPEEAKRVFRRADRLDL